MSLLALLLLAGCGQRGPLMLPDTRPPASVPGDPAAAGETAPEDDDEENGER